MPILVDWQKKSARKQPHQRSPGRFALLRRLIGIPPSLTGSGLLLWDQRTCHLQNAQDKHSLVQSLPIERILLETDCPYLTPPHPPHRGERNEPSYIPYIASKIAQLKKPQSGRGCHANGEERLYTFWSKIRLI